MSSVMASVIEVSIAWGLPALLTGVFAWAAVKRKAIKNWLRAGKNRRRSTEAMVASWPTALEFIKEAKTREESAVARESRVTSEFTALREHLGRQDTALDHIAGQLWGAMRFDVQAKFQCDVTGRNVQVNAAYATLMRVGEFELVGFGWKNRVVETDRREYELAAEQAFREHRKFERKVRFQRGDGSRFMGRVRLEPYPEDPADLGSHEALWFGSVTWLEDID